MAVCMLCKTDRQLKNSHIIPQFVFNKIKENSPTGYMRSMMLQPDLRKQDGDKNKMLCNECEQRFASAEKNFAEQVFEPYHEAGVTSFKYGSWLSYFICSVNWRTLHLDNIGFHAEKKWSSDALGILDEAETILADFLLGKKSDIGHIENHILPMFEITNADSGLAEPNLYFRASAFDYTYFIPNDNAYYVCANLAGVLIFTVIRKTKNDVWENTLVRLNNGSINGPQKISSPLIPDMVDFLEQISKMEISKVQKNKINKSLRQNQQANQARAVQYRKLDENLHVLD